MDTIKTFLSEDSSDNSKLSQLMHTLDVYFSETDYNIASSIVAYAMFDANMHTLELSARKGKVGVLNYIFKHNPHITTDHIHAAIILATINNHPDTVKYLVSQANANIIDKSIVLIATEFGYLDIVKYFIDACPVDKDGLLIDAAQLGHLDIVKYLVEDHGVHTEIIKSNISYLKPIVQSGHLQMVKYFIDKYPSDDDLDKRYLLVWAALDGHLDIVKYLVEVCRVDVHAFNNSAFMYAAREGYLNVVKYFVEACGINVHTNNDLALTWAVEHRRIDVVIYLVNQGDDSDDALHDDAVSEDAHSEGE